MQYVVHTKSPFMKESITFELPPASRLVAQRLAVKVKSDVKRSGIIDSHCIHLWLNILLLIHTYVDSAKVAVTFRKGATPMHWSGCSNLLIPSSFVLPRYWIGRSSFRSVPYDRPSPVTCSFQGVSCTSEETSFFYYKGPSRQATCMTSWDGNDMSLRREKMNCSEDAH